MKTSPHPRSFVQTLESDYPIDIAFLGVADEVHAILAKKIRGTDSADSYLQLLENMMDASPDGTGIVQGHRLAVIDRIRTALWFAGLLKLGQALKTEEHQIFFSRLMFSFMGSRLKNPDAAFKADMEDFGDFTRGVGFEVEGSYAKFIKDSPACYYLFVPKKVAA